MLPSSGRERPSYFWVSLMLAILDFHPWLGPVVAREVPITLTKTASMVIAREAMTMRVIGKRFDNSTVCDLTATANLNHALKF